MARNIDIGLLRAFATVAETGSMTRASRLLHVTQAAISQQVKRLEELLQVQLIDRSARQLTLTPAGDSVLLHAQRMLGLNDDLWATMTQPPLAGEVRLGVPSDILRPFLPPVLKSFAQSWPGIQVRLVGTATIPLIEKLEAGEIDLTLTTEEDCGPGCESLLEEELVWVGARGGRAWQRTPVPLAFGEPRCTFRSAMTRALRNAGRDWRIVTDNSNCETMLATAEADLAVVAMLPTAVPDHFEVLGPESGLPRLSRFHINLRVPSQGASKLGSALACHIREQFSGRYAQAA
ncbi:LysR family transcriptional regulator [Zavarzinia sp. CC-PAN008]|uniref:LysR family transcriptional regulator n=1 Tax=Zavarzinia sp. CC-PAN008 TaxID=3243332 RepID=UPI003F747687